VGRKILLLMLIVLLALSGFYLMGKAIFESIAQVEKNLAQVEKNLARLKGGAMKDLKLKAEITLGEKTFVINYRKEQWPLKYTIYYLDFPEGLQIKIHDQFDDGVLVGYEEKVILTSGAMTITVRPNWQIFYDDTEKYMIKRELDPQFWFESEKDGALHAFVGTGFIEIGKLTYDYLHWHTAREILDLAQNILSQLKNK